MICYIPLKKRKQNKDILKTKYYFSYHEQKLW